MLGLMLESILITIGGSQCRLMWHADQHEATAAVQLDIPEEVSRLRVPTTRKFMKAHGPWAKEKEQPRCHHRDPKRRLRGDGDEEEQEDDSVSLRSLCRLEYCSVGENWHAKLRVDLSDCIERKEMIDRPASNLQHK
jgi:hypothetical protein